MAFVAFLDACVLYPAALRDVILSIAEAGICQIRWSPDVLDEMERNVGNRAKAKSLKAARAGAKYVRSEMENAFPDAMVPRKMYEMLIPTMPNEEKDRHVLAAAIVARADVLVTANLKDFRFDPEFATIDVQHPDKFLCHQLELSPDAFFATLEDLASQRHEPMNTVEGILNSLVKTVPEFSRKALEMYEGHSQSD
ncbi:PIN domain-containing protein [Alicyclobacillus macrosporangiidus]|uniref:PIN domain-containing protein n=1 Tax=Alicyclobacillus macrosporangiidus TaxID=392015 RepID=A0A1I7L1Z4_9BACL|nr:PIN domain-containing protein [Alicyclobacillus macrosporangiidus]SFV03779.1 PIN domain-containing protein [Alicyclobacillus macrosporangiidus]